MPAHVLAGSGHLAPHAAGILREVERVQAACAPLLGLAPASVDVVVQDLATRAIPELGIGGFNRDAHTVFISLDPAHPAFDAVVERQLARSVAHELHHAARRRGPGYGRTLFEALVSEGLADHFSIAFTGCDPPPWTRALDGAELEAVALRARESYDDPEYDHGAWFYGRDPASFPRWAGYTLGFEFVAQHLAGRDGATAASLVRAPASDFGGVR